MKFSRTFFENSTEKTKRNIIGDRVANASMITPRKESLVDEMNDSRLGKTETNPKNLLVSESPLSGKSMIYQATTA